MVFGRRTSTNVVMQADQENGESASGTPQAFLNSVVGQPVWVRLNSGIDYKGTALARFGGIADVQVS
jgi:hypothetical protein